MPATTTIRLDEELRRRVAAAAEREGKSSHAFIVEAIAQTVEQAELKSEFYREADKRWLKILDQGKTVPWGEMRDYLAARASGGRGARRPRARKLER